MSWAQAFAGLAEVVVLSAGIWLIRETDKGR